MPRLVQDRAEYEAVLEEMLKRTDRPGAPWHVVAGDSKRSARVEVIETVCRAVEQDLAARGYDLELPQ